MNETVHAPKPAPVFFGYNQDEKALLQNMAAIDRQERTISRRRRVGGRVGWMVAAVLGGAVVAQSFTIAALFPLRQVQEKFVVLRSDNTSQVVISNWDLPTLESEQLILATAKYYTRACESWNWASEPDNYAYCNALSATERRKQFDDYTDPKKNPESPQKIYKDKVVVSVIPTGVWRVGPNSIRVLTIRVEMHPHSPPITTREMTTLDYLPVRTLPADVALSFPAADIQFVHATVEPDITPISPILQGAIK